MSKPAETKQQSVNTKSGLQPIVKQGSQVQGFVLKASLMPEAQ